jgi:hypothetical protein
MLDVLFAGGQLDLGTGLCTRTIALTTCPGRRREGAQTIADTSHLML